MQTMVASHHFTRVDTIELKDLIYRKIGHQRAEIYFDQLKRFFSLKLSKVELDRNCIRTIGRENVWLHNKLIRSILQNACHAKIPPQKARKVEGLSVKVQNGYQKNCLQSLYGDAFPQSPRKSWSPVSRDRKLRDRPSPLGPLGKSPSVTCEETVTRTQEQQSVTEFQSLCSRPPVGVVSVEDGEEVEQFSEGHQVQHWTSVTAPIGVSFDSVNARKARRYNAFADNTCQRNLELPDSIALSNHLEKKLASEGLAISPDCANLLNNSLDAYLKRLIQPCIAIAGSRRTEPCILGRQSSSGSNAMLPGTLADRQPQSKSVSMLDFRVAMESNPRILGENWPIQLEKICHYASGEQLQ